MRFERVEATFFQGSSAAAQLSLQRSPLHSLPSPAPDELPSPGRARPELPAVPRAVWPRIFLKEFLAEGSNTGNGLAFPGQGSPPRPRTHSLRKPPTPLPAPPPPARVASQPHRSTSGSRMLSGCRPPTFQSALRRVWRPSLVNPGPGEPRVKRTGLGCRYWILAGRERKTQLSISCGKPILV